MPLQPVKSYFDGDRTVPFQYGPVTVSRPFANTPTLDTYAIERMTAFDVLPSKFAAGSRIAARTSYTNALTFSEQLDNAAWTKGAMTVATNQFANPQDGLMTMDGVFETSANSQHSIGRTITVITGLTTLSAFCAPINGRNWVYLSLSDSAANSFNAFFNLATGAVGTMNSLFASSIAAMGNGIFRISITFSPVGGAASLFLLSSPDGSAISFAGATAKGFYLWGFQQENAASVGPYISTTVSARTILAPDWWDTTAATYSSGDTPDPFAFLCDESDPDTDSVSGDYLFKRTWDRLPKTQVVQTSIAITKPAVPNQSSGAVTFFIQSATSDLLTSGGVGAYYANNLFSPLNVINGSTVGTNVFYGPLIGGSTNASTAVSSGVFTLNYRGSATSNLNYNDTIATILTALNGLATVIDDGLTFAAGTSANNLNTTGILLLTLSAGATNFRVVINASGFSPPAAATAFTLISTTTQQLIQTAYIASIPSHGFDITKVLAITGGSIGEFGSQVIVLQPRPLVTGFGQWSIIDANTIAYVAGYIFGGLFGQPLRSYTPGPDRVGAQLSTSFYLPGVTVGITTDADIPIPSPLLNDTDFLAAVLTNTSGYLNYDASDLTPWSGPIMQQTQKLINFADV